jgi:carboxypeptidase C (cathepsin A)
MSDHNTDSASPATPPSQTPTDTARSETGAGGHTPPAGATTEHRFQTANEDFRYHANADWLVLRDNDDKPTAELFYVAYTREDGEPAERPVTFVLNGGPGAAAVYLHLGAMGPYRAVFDADGRPPAPPAELETNPHSWLPFTDLVFIDPVGTGWSRSVDTKQTDSGQQSSQSGEPNDFYEVGKDLAAICEFVTRWLSQFARWRSPVYLAGESYGGFRVAKISRQLQETYGVGLNGIFLVSPVFEFKELMPTDYDALGYVDRLPSMAAAAHFHERSRAFSRDASLDEILAEAESFAMNDYTLLLVQGRAMGEDRAASTESKAARLIGLPDDELHRAEGRIDMARFARELLRDERRVCGVHDACATLQDPYPDRSKQEGPDPALFAIDRVFAAAINSHLRETLAVDTQRHYRLINFDVNHAWKRERDRHGLDARLGATDDLRYGMALNPYMQVSIIHGVYDLVTPYLASRRLAQLMKLTEAQKQQIELTNIEGGHMFYLRGDAREQFAALGRNRIAPDPP